MAVTVVAVLASVVVSSLDLGGGSAKLGASGSSATTEEEARFLSGTTINGVDVSGMNTAEAASALSADVESYAFTLALGGSTYTGSQADLSLAYNDDADLTALLESQTEDEILLTLTLENAYTADVSAFVTQVEEDYNARLLEELTGGNEEAGETAESETEAEETETEAASETESETAEALLAELAAPPERLHHL